jgi:hypothetical protein
VPYLFDPSYDARREIRQYRISSSGERNMMSEPEFETKDGSLKYELSEKQAKLLQYLKSKLSVPIEDLSESMVEVRGLIDAGLAKLKIEQRPWGIEFSVVTCTTEVHMNKNHEERKQPSGTEARALPSRIKMSWGL